MLNSQDLAELKIQALLQNTSNQYPAKICADFVSAFNPASSDHIIIKNSSNSNILSFSYVLLAHIFDVGTAQNSSNSSQSQTARENNGSSSKNTDKLFISSPSNKTKQYDQFYQSKLKLFRVYSFLLNEKINFAQIVNIPQKLQRLLQQFCSKQSDHKQKKRTQNLYLKKILIQFLKSIYQSSKQSSTPSKNSNQHSSPSSSTPSCPTFSNQNQTNQNSSPQIKQFCIASAFQKYSICQVIITLFIRSILYFEYQIIEALDYNKQISDHTIYTALCDAFQYNTLKLQENYTEISHGSFIRLIRLKQIKYNGKKTRNTLSYYLVSLPLCKLQCLPYKQHQDIDSFRVRRKSSDNSNNQSVSFRQNSKLSQKKSLNSNSNNKSSLFASNQKSHDNTLITVQNTNTNNIQNKKEVKAAHQKYSLRNKEELHQKIKSQKQIQPKQSEFKKQKTSNQINHNNIQNPQNITKIQENDNMFRLLQISSENNISYLRNTLPTDLNGYTNLQILKQLSPKIRDSMIKNISHFKNVVV